MNNGVNVSCSNVAFSGYMSIRGISGPYGRFIPNFLRNYVLHNGSTSLHSVGLILTVLSVTCGELYP